MKCLHAPHLLRTLTQRIIIGFSLQFIEHVITCKNKINMKLKQCAGAYQSFIVINRLFCANQTWKKGLCLYIGPCKPNPPGELKRI